MTKIDKVVPDTEKNETEVNPKPPLKKGLVKNSKKINWSARFLLLLLIFIGGMASAIYFMPVLKDRLPIIATWIGDTQNASIAPLNQKINEQETIINGLSQKISDVEMRLNQLSTEDTSEILTRLESLEASISAPNEPILTSEDTSQSARIDMLLSRMSQLEAAFVPLSKNLIEAQSATQERLNIKQMGEQNTTKLSTLENRLIQLEQFAAKDNSTILLNLTLAELRRKVVSGKSYLTEISKIKEMTDDRYQDALDYLSTHAPTGILTPGQLQSRFTALIPELLSTPQVNSNQSWWQNTVDRFKNIITVRKTDGSSYGLNDLDPKIAEIESWLNRFDLQSALNILLTLPAELQPILEDWKSNAEIWLDSEKALSELESLTANIDTSTPLEAPL